MTLYELLRTADLHPVEMLGDAEVGAITIDSRRCGPGSLFVCMPQMTRESETFLPDAVANGAKAAVVHSREGMQLAQSLGIAAVLSPHVGSGFNETTWRLADAFYDHPTRDMQVVGVTGTNGKTTTAWLIRDMLRAAGVSAAYLGTLGFQLPGENRELQNTTPFAVELYGMLAEARDLGVKALALEVSSHALAQRRADGIELDAAVFTNLTQDHLDFHGTMEEYAAAKWRLFSDLPALSEKSFLAAFNMDDPIGRDWAERQDGADPNPIRYGLSDDHGPLDLHFEITEVRVDSIDGYLNEIPVRIPLGGAYNVHNALSAAAGMLALGYRAGEIATLLPQVRPVPGRFEAVPNDRGIGVLVDYAHTPDALYKLLLSVRELTQGRVITVFGCGGDRDRAKRPLMARVVSELSDLTVVTSDNPRTEDPVAILKETVLGIVPGLEFRAIEDRREAVAEAIQTAQPGDVVVIAGKGHENYQIVGHTKHHLDDRELVREALSRSSP